MGDVILIIAVAAVMIFGFFIMKRIDVFLEKNRKATEREQEEQCSVRLNSWTRKTMKTGFPRLKISKKP